MITVRIEGLFASVDGSFEFQGAEIDMPELVLTVKHENDREMFKIDIFTAMDKIREIGAIFQAGQPKIF